MEESGEKAKGKPRGKIPEVNAIIIDLYLILQSETGHSQMNLVFQIPALN